MEGRQIFGGTMGDQGLSAVVSQIEELRAKQAASEAFLVHVLAPLVLAHDRQRIGARTHHGDAFGVSGFD
jgi:hypothetical protein